MKKPAPVIIMSLFALIVIISLQFYTVRRIYLLEMDRMQNQYKDIIRFGLDAFKEQQPDNGHQTAYLALDYQSKQLYNFYQSGAVTDTLAFRQVVLQKIHNEFDRYQTIESLVEKLLENEGVDTRFECFFIFREFNIENWNDTLTIYNEGSDAEWQYRDTVGISSKSIFMGGYQYLSNNFNCRYDFYIDFKEMEKVVLAQLTGILIFMFLSLIIVGVIFAITLRNMIEERRLSMLKTDFINNMTHELKTPLSTISIATKSLDSEKILGDREKVKNTVRIIDRQNRNLNKQINHLLEVSMWERKQFELDKKWVRLKNLMEDVIESFRMECKSIPLTLHSDCRIPDQLEVFIDEFQIITAIHNLLKNAVKYNDNDPVIAVRCTVEGQWIVIKVKDNGIGIANEDLKHIFEKFYRVSTGNVHKVKGLGLGLFYVKQIVDAHKGTINLVSKKRKGTEFTVKLPYNGRAKNSTGRG